MRAPVRIEEETMASEVLRVLHWDDSGCLGAELEVTCDGFID